MPVRLKNITLGSVAIQMYRTPTPKVKELDAPVILFLSPGESVDVDHWLVDNTDDPSYNKDIIDSLVSKGIATSISVPSLNEPEPVPYLSNFEVTVQPYFDHFNIVYLSIGSDIPVASRFNILGISSSNSQIVSHFNIARVSGTPEPHVIPQI